MFSKRKEVYNPIIFSDFPDPDVIRVNDTYYMVSTTMHFMPGGTILRSYNLVDWEIIGHVFHKLENSPQHRMEGGEGIYGQGMWAPSFRYNNGFFYICFSANDTQKTYLFKSESIKGPWKKREISGFYHDPSLFFDNDGKTYIIYGNSDIFITQMNLELSAPLTGGLHKILVSDNAEMRLGYEGSHFYKIKGRYYLFLIHWLPGESGMRTQACFSASSLLEEFTGGDVFCDDNGFYNQGIAQGGVVDTPCGEWYSVLFQDRGALGRVPFLVPVKWKDGVPVFGDEGKLPEMFSVPDNRPDYNYRKIETSDDFIYKAENDSNVFLDNSWQWNHLPRPGYWEIENGSGVLSLRTDRTSDNLVCSKNILTQRAMGPSCSARVMVDGTLLNNGDYAGICALQGKYSYMALHKEKDNFFLVLQGKPGGVNHVMGKKSDRVRAKEYTRIPWFTSSVEMCISLDFENKKDEALFSFFDNGFWKALGEARTLFFGLDHFTGCRIGLFCFSTKQPGGSAGFSGFDFHVPKVISIIP